MDLREKPAARLRKQQFCKCKVNLVIGHGTTAQTINEEAFLFTMTSIFI